MRKTKGYWDKENVFEEAKKYKTKSEFQNDSPRAYDVARENKWLKEMDWFEEVKKPRGYWDKEKCYEIAKQYKTKKEFRKGSMCAYNVSLKHGWLSEMFGETRKPNGYWDKENVFAEAKKYKTRNEFKKGYETAYQVARKNKWIDILFPKKVA